MVRAVCLLAAAGVLALAGPAFAAQDAQAQAWTAKKCRFYDRAWHELLALSGRKGISAEFIAGNDAFIAAGCTTGADICPRSPEEGALVNQLTVATMNFGTASSFVPFVCRGTTAPLPLH